MTATFDSVALDRPGRSRAFWSVMTTFLIHGLVVSAWVSRVASIKVLLHLSDAVLGLSLLGAAVGSVIAIPICGSLVAHFGARAATRWSTFGFSMAVVLPALAWGPVSLFVALLVFGAMGGANDVAMNAEGVALEKLVRIRAISRFHAMFSVGGILGSAAGAFIAWRGVLPVWHLAGDSLVCLALGAIGTALMPRLPSDPSASEATPGSRSMFRRLPAALVALGAIGFCILLSEGAIADWSGVYLRQVLNTSDGFAPLGYAVFSAFMAVFRLAGDAIAAKFGGAATVRYGAVISAAGLLLVVVAGAPWQVLAGFGAAGIGFSSIIPLVFAAGGRSKSVAQGIGVATVSGIGYMGFLVGPPLIGLISQAASLRWGLFLLVALSSTTMALAGYVNRRDANLWG